MEIKKAGINNWDVLLPFFTKIYRQNHPLQNLDFFNWQFGSEEHGASYIAVANNEIVGHLGVAVADGYAWHMNLYIVEGYRASTALFSLFNAVKPYGRLGSLTANARLVEIYRSLGWYQYYNLIRLTIINPALQGSPIENIVTPARAIPGNTLVPKGHYWRQPGLQGLQLPDGSTAVAQNNVGGMRFVHIQQPQKALSHAWENGFNWVDYITSFNNPLLPRLMHKGWKADVENGIPWLLNPVEKHSFAQLPFLTEKPIDIKFYINRTHSDIGRVGSLPPM